MRPCSWQDAMHFRDRPNQGQQQIHSSRLLGARVPKPAGCQRDLWTHELDCRRSDAPSEFIHGSHLFVPVLPAHWTLNWSAPSVAQCISTLSLSCLFTALQTTLLYPAEQASKVCDRSWSEVHRKKFCFLYFFALHLKNPFPVFFLRCRDGGYAILSTLNYCFKWEKYL